MTTQEVTSRKLKKSALQARLTSLKVDSKSNRREKAARVPRKRQGLNYNHNKVNWNWWRWKIMMEERRKRSVVMRTQVFLRWAV